MGDFSFSYIGKVLEIQMGLLIVDYIRVLHFGIYFSISFMLLRESVRESDGSVDKDTTGPLQLLSFDYQKTKPNGQ